MADYYTELSVEIMQNDVDFPLDDVFHIMEALEEGDHASLPEAYRGLFEEDTEENPDDDYMEETLDIKYVLNKDSLWFYSTGYPNLELIVNIIQTVMRIHDSKCAVGFEWGYTCSKPRTDGFGGGAVYITKDSQDWLSTQGWLASKRDAFKKDTAG